MASLVKSHRAAKGSAREMYPDRKKKQAAAKKSAPTPSPKPSRKDSPSPPKPGTRKKSGAKMPKASMAGGGVNKTTTKATGKGPRRENPPSSASGKKTIAGKSPKPSKTIVGVQRDQTGREARVQSWRDLGNKVKGWFSGEMADRKKNRRTIK